MGDGTYWIRVEPGADWQIAELHDGEWMVCGSEVPVVPAEIGRQEDPPGFIPPDDGEPFGH